jgi:hypothetical protein
VSYEIKTLILTGEDKYTWDNPHCSDSELEDSVRVLARYHDAVFDLKPEGRRYEPRIVELLPTISGNFMKYAMWRPALPTSAQPGRARRTVTCFWIEWSFS